MALARIILHAAWIDRLIGLFSPRMETRRIRNRETAAELLEIERLIATGVRRVKNADGREIEYRSLAELCSIRDRLRGAK